MVAKEVQTQHWVGDLETEQWIMTGADADKHQGEKHGSCSDLETWVRLWQTEKREEDCFRLGQQTRLSRGKKEYGVWGSSHIEG